MSTETQKVDVCPLCREPVIAGQSWKWWTKKDGFGFRGSRAPTRRYLAHVVCPNFYTKQIDRVNASFDEAIESVSGNQPAIDALNAARAAELAQINSRAALARVGGAL